MAETATVQNPAIEAMQERLNQLERTVKRLKRNIRRLVNDEFIHLDLSPEMEAELERRLAEVQANPGQGLTLDEYKAEMRKRFPGL